MYNKTVWESEEGTGLNRFHDSISGQTLELTRQPTSVTRAGTVFSVDAMNNIEDGIESLDLQVEALEEKTLLEETIVSTNLTALGQTSRLWVDFAVLGNDVYGIVENGDIYKQTNGAGNFIALGQTSRLWTSIASLGSDVYACVRNNGDIYKQTNGAGNFIALGQTLRDWRSIASLGADVYACVYGGDIYKQTNGAGNFIALGQTSRLWTSIASHNNSMYAVDYNGLIYKQTNGAGNFVAISSLIGSWKSITSLGGHLYISGNNLYRYDEASDTLLDMNQGSILYGLTAKGTDIYGASGFSGDIYKATNWAILDTPLRTYNLTSTAPISIYPTADLGEPKTFRKISSDTNVITITLPSGHTFADGSSSITLTNQYEEVTIERVSSTKWTAEQGVKKTDSPTFNELSTSILNVIGTTAPIKQQAFDGNIIYRRFRSATNGGGGGIFPSHGATNPQWGTLYAYNVVDPTIFCRYSIYKEPGIAPVFTLIQNGGGLIVNATNAAGTITLNDTSTNIRMIAEVIYGDFT